MDLRARRADALLVRAHASPVPGATSLDGPARCRRARPRLVRRPSVGAQCCSLLFACPQSYPARQDRRDGIPNSPFHQSGVRLPDPYLTTDNDGRLPAPAPGAAITEASPAGRGKAGAGERAREGWFYLGYLAK